MLERTTLPGRMTPAPADQSPDKGIAALGALTSLGAVFAAASCCVLPLTLGALGIGAGFSSTFGVLTPLRWPLTIFATVATAGGWWFYLRRRRACSMASCAAAAPRRTTFITLAVSTVLVVFALSWGLFEAPLIGLVS